MTRNGNRPIETRLLSEWLAIRFPDRRILQRVRVGSDSPDLDIPGLDDAERRMLVVWRRWVDAIVVEGNALRVIEAAVIPNPGKVSQLDLYIHLVRLTPELAEYRTWQIIGVLLCAVDDPVIHRLAADRGYAVEIYHPRWVDSYLQSLAPRRRRATLSGFPADAAVPGG